MLLKNTQRLLKPFLLLSSIGAIAALIASSTIEQPATSYIVSAKDFASLQQSATTLNLSVSHQLPIIDALAIDLTEQQLTDLQQLVNVTVSLNQKVELSGWAKGKRRWQPKATLTDVIDATQAHNAGNFGGGVTIGFLDTGLDQLKGLSRDLYGYDKAWGTYDAVNNSIHNYDDEASGHGTHVASIAANSDFDIYGKIYGVAPNAAIVGIKAFDREGKATYADVIRGIDWAIKVKDQINLRVLNMSFSGQARSNYWDDPLNKAVMKAWQAGIVVVASSGNRGPEPMTIGVPGNVPYIITVGAMTDNYTPGDTSDDKLASFSSAGPTAEAFVKPEIVAPGGHISGLMSFDSQLAVDHPEFHDGGQYFQMSGTSQATAVVSGVVALMLTDNPSLTPDQVKCRLIDSAHRAINAENKLAYSVFQQGAGVVNALDAISSNAYDCANQGLDIAKDLSGEAHYWGPANIDSAGNFYIEGLGDEYSWNENNGVVDSDILIWKNSLWSDILIWKNSSITDASVWQNGFETDILIWKNSVDTDILIWKNSLDTDILIWKNNLDSNQVTTIDVNSWVTPQ